MRQPAPLPEDRTRAAARPALRAAVAAGLAAALLAAGCTRLVTRPLPDRPVTRHFAGDAAQWQDGRKVYFVFDTFESNGFVGLCGAIAASSGDALSHNFDDLMIQSRRIELNETVLANDISFFSRLPFVDGRYPAGDANCVETDVPWEPRYANLRPDMKASRKRFMIVN